MQVRVVKRKSGRVDLMVISHSYPPLPPLVSMGVPVKCVAGSCREMVDQVTRARSRAVLGGTTVPGHNGTGTRTTGQ